MSSVVKTISRRVSGAYNNAINKPSSRKSLSISESSASFRYILVIPDYWKDDDVDTIFKNSDNLNKQKESNNIQVYQTSDIRNRDFLTPIPCFEAHPSFHIVSPSFFNPGLYVRSENGSNVFLKASDFSRDVLLLKAKRIEITLACNNVSEATIDFKWLLDSSKATPNSYRFLVQGRLQLKPARNETRPKSNSATPNSNGKPRHVRSVRKIHSQMIRLV